MTQANTKLVVGRAHFDEGVLASAELPLLFIHETWVEKRSVEFEALAIGRYEVESYQLLARLTFPGMYITWINHDINSRRFIYFWETELRGWRYEIGEVVWVDKDGIVKETNIRSRGKVVFGGQSVCDLYNYISHAR